MNQSASWRSWAGWAAKMLIAAALLFWLIERGILDFRAIGRGLTRWPHLLLVALCYYVQLALIAARWNCLLGGLKIHLKWREAFSLTMIGALFALVTPSAVGGDLMKSYYAVQRARGRSAEALASIVLDRVFGLLALFVTAALAALPSLTSPDTPPTLRLLDLLSTLGALGGIAGISAAIVLSRRLSGIGPSNRILAFAWRALSSIAAYREQPRVLVLALLYGVASFAITCVAFYLSALALDESFPAGLLFLVPLGLLATALPISPAGIGVGQVAFAELLRIGSSGEFSGGANVFTVFQAVLILVNLSGFVSFLFYRQELGEMQNAAERT